MKRGILTFVNRFAFGVAIGIALCLLMGAAANKAPKHWQDVLLRLDQPWLNQYGYSPESVLAYNDWKQNRVINSLGTQLAGLTERIKALEDTVKKLSPVDVNGVD